MGQTCRERARGEFRGATGETARPVAAGRGDERGRQLTTEPGRKGVRSRTSKAGHSDCRYSARLEQRLEVRIDFDSRGRSPGPVAEMSRTDRPGLPPGVMVASQLTADAPLVTASVWHRPVITDATRDQLAERQARAAIALVRMGRPAEIMPLLGTAPIPAFAASSSPGFFAWVRIHNELSPSSTGSTPAPRPSTRKGNSGWTRSCSTPRPPSGGR